MRNRVPVFMALVVMAAFVSALLWQQWRTAREELQASQLELQATQQDLQMAQQDLEAARRALQSERNLSDRLRGELADAQARPAVAAPAPPVQLPTVPPNLVAALGRQTDGYVSIASVGAQRDKMQLDDPEYRKARIALTRASLKQRNPLLALELGISDEQADAIFDVMAEGQLSQESQQLELRASGNVDAAAIERLQRLQAAQQQQDQNKLAAMLGPEKYRQLEEIQQTNTAHVRMVNIKNLLAQSGTPLSTDQALSMTRVMASAQQREEREMEQLRSSGQWSQVPEVDRAAEGDRRILQSAAGILTSQQLELVRAQFEKRQEMEKATGMVTLRARGWGH